MAGLATDDKGNIVNGILEIFPSQNITISAGASVAISTALTKPFIRIACDVACYVDLGNTGVSSTATTSMLLPAGAIDYLQRGTKTIVSALAYSATGVLSVTEMA